LIESGSHGKFNSQFSDDGSYLYSSLTYVKFIQIMWNPNNVVD